MGHPAPGPSLRGRVVKKFITALILLSVTSVIASPCNIVWLELKPSFRYRDVTVSCSTDWGQRIMLSAEFCENKITRGWFQIQSHWLLPAGESIAIEPDELEGQKFYIDEGGRYWLSTMTLSSRLLNWFFFHSSGWFDRCVPPMAIIDINPVPYPFEFARSLPGENLVTSESQTGKFSGTRKDTRYFEASLGFLQKPYERMASRWSAPK